MQTANNQTNIDTRFLEYARVGDTGGLLATGITFRANPFVIGSDGLDAMQLVARLPAVVELVVDAEMGLTLSNTRSSLLTLIQSLRDMYYVAPQANTLQ
ncbi:hypothetical protein [Burkholderia vietnamiensis]|uniref:hypothetical protein n=1 Tax=Burkholderia vietnamiensis TaxID=60552 RepID=UPI001CF10E9D|nr:hypothetical protein [Burkholderia vietnamiensis]MCA8448924.1 hypothetical protein [Burkholderia vietnamiensis]